MEEMHRSRQGGGEEFHCAVFGHLPISEFTNWKITWTPSTKISFSMEVSICRYNSGEREEFKVPCF